MTPFPAATWRLLREPAPQSGALNLATDEAILHAVAAGDAPPTLRLYSWSLPALTLGRGQSYHDADLAALLADGVTLLRRATGGTAVYHDETEFTYTVAAPRDEVRFSGDVVESYHSLGAAWVATLAQVGVANAKANAHPQARNGRSQRDPVCFVIPSDYEITVEYRKLVGSAQMRTRGGILQHGSVYLRGDIARICDYLAVDSAPEHVRAHALTLQDVLGRAVSWDAMVDAVVQAFSKHLNLTLVPGELLSSECAELARLVTEKYTNVEWTKRL